MNKTWLIILGALAAGFAAFLLLPHVLPGGKATPAEPAVVGPSDPDTAAPLVDAPEGELPAVPPTSEDGGGIEGESEDAVEGLPPPVDPSAVTEPAIDGFVGSGEYPHSVEIAGVEVYWANDAARLWVGLIAPGTGYVAVGFDPERQMEGANYIIGYVKDGKLYVRDDYGTERTSHMADIDRGGTDDILASAGTEWPDHTVLEFVIPLDSGDAMDKVLVPGSAYAALVAYHDLQDSFTARHSRRGAGEIRLDPAP